MSLKKRTIYPTRNLEEELKSKGYEFVAGIDESGGSGASAGPTVACFLLLKPGYSNPRIRDSKAFDFSATVSGRNRFDDLAEEIIANALCVGFGVVTVDEINEIGDKEAVSLAMERAYEEAVREYGYTADIVVIDGHTKELAIDIDQIFRFHADQDEFIVAAASILARYKRCKLMDELRNEYVKYTGGYDIYSLRSNFGYPIGEHPRALKQYGACPFHKARVIKKFGSFRGLQGTYSGLVLV